MSDGIIDEIGKFLTDLVLGDFEADQGKAAMVIGGAISLVPGVDQVMDVRDVAGMIFRISKKGINNASADDWVDTALAAFGCIPEVGSLFKTIVKPLRKMRKEAKAAGTGGNVMIEAMLAKSKGAAIKFMKGFNWAQNTQLAIQAAMDALDACISLLDILSQKHWWLSPELQYTARDLRPQLGAVRAPLRAGISKGAIALEEAIKDILGEDAVRVAQHITYAAVVVGNAGARHNVRPVRAARSSVRNNAGESRRPRSNDPSPGRGVEHKPQSNSHVQIAEHGNGPNQNARRPIKDLLDEVSFGNRGLVGEHMADYYHMEHKLSKIGTWPHGNPRGEWSAPFPRIVNAYNAATRPKELIPEDLLKVTTSGVDSIWHVDRDTYHFIEAKASASGGALYGLGQKKMKSTASGAIPPAPSDLTARQFALWSLLGEPKKGTQMSWRWIIASVVSRPIRAAANHRNRWVYLFLALPTVGAPFGSARKANEKPLELGVAGGMEDHLSAAATLLATGDFLNMSLHDLHKPTHGISEIFEHNEIDFIERRRRVLRSRPSSSPDDRPGRENTSRQSTSSRPTRSKRK